MGAPDLDPERFRPVEPGTDGLDPARFKPVEGAQDAFAFRGATAQKAAGNLTRMHAEEAAAAAEPEPAEAGEASGAMPARRSVLPPTSGPGLSSVGKVFAPVRDFGQSVLEGFDVLAAHGLNQLDAFAYGKPRPKFDAATTPGAGPFRAGRSIFDPAAQALTGHTVREATDELARRPELYGGEVVRGFGIDPEQHPTVARVAGGATAGLARVGEGLTTPGNIAVAPAIGMVKAGPPIAKFLGAMVDAGFTVEMASNALQKAPEAVERLKAGDVAGAVQAATETIVSAGLAVGAGRAGLETGRAGGRQFAELNRRTGDRLRAERAAREAAMSTKQLKSPVFGDAEPVDVTLEGWQPNAGEPPDLAAQGAPVSEPAPEEVNLPERRAQPRPPYPAPEAPVEPPVPGPGVPIDVPVLSQRGPFPEAEIPDEFEPPFRGPGPFDTSGIGRTEPLELDPARFVPVERGGYEQPPGQGPAQGAPGEEAGGGVPGQAPVLAMPQAGPGTGATVVPNLSGAGGNQPQAPGAGAPPANLQAAGQDANLAGAAGGAGAGGPGSPVAGAAAPRVPERPLVARRRRLKGGHPAQQPGAVEAVPAVVPAQAPRAAEGAVVQTAPEAPPEPTPAQVTPADREQLERLAQNPDPAAVPEDLTRKIAARRNIEGLLEMMDHTEGAGGVGRWQQGSKEENALAPRGQEGRSVGVSSPLPKQLQQFKWEWKDIRRVARQGLDGQTITTSQGTPSKAGREIWRSIERWALQKDGPIDEVDLMAFFGEQGIVAKANAAPVDEERAAIAGEPEGDTSFPTEPELPARIRELLERFDENAGTKKLSQGELRALRDAGFADKGSGDSRSFVLNERGRDVLRSIRSDAAERRQRREAQRATWPEEHVAAVAALDPALAEKMRANTATWKEVNAALQGETGGAPIAETDWAARAEDARRKLAVLKPEGDFREYNRLKDEIRFFEQKGASASALSPEASERQRAEEEREQRQREGVKRPAIAETGGEQRGLGLQLTEDQGRPLDQQDLDIKLREETSKYGENVSRLRAEIDRRYASGKTRGVEILEQRLAGLEEAATHAEEDRLEHGDEHSDALEVGMDGEFADVYRRVLRGGVTGLSREEAPGVLRSVMQRHNGGFEAAQKGTDAQLLDAARDAYDAQVVRRGRMRGTVAERAPTYEGHAAAFDRKRDAQLAEWRERVGDDRLVELQEKNSPDRTVIISRDLLEPGRWRATRMHGDQPAGHHVFDSKEDALAAYSGKRTKDGGPPMATAGSFVIKGTLAERPGTYGGGQPVEPRPDLPDMGGEADPQGTGERPLRPEDYGGAPEGEPENLTERDRVKRAGGQLRENPAARRDIARRSNPPEGEPSLWRAQPLPFDEAPARDPRPDFSKLPTSKDITIVGRASKKPTTIPGAHLVAQRYDRILKQKGRIDWYGQPVRDAIDVAHLAALTMRSPRVETSVLAAVKQGKVVGMLVTSTGSSAQAITGVDRWQINAWVKAHGVDAIYHAHNHPSGDPNPSQEDRTAMRQMRDSLGPVFKGGVVIDHGRFAVIDVQSGGAGPTFETTTMHEVPAEPSESLGHPDKPKGHTPTLEGKIAHSPRETSTQVARLVKTLGMPPDRFTVVYVGSRGAIVGVEDFNLADLFDADSGLAQHLRDSASAWGAWHSFGYADEGAYEMHADKALSDALGEAAPEDVARFGGRTSDFGRETRRRLNVEKLMYEGLLTDIFRGRDKRADEAFEPPIRSGVEERGYTGPGHLGASKRQFQLNRTGEKELPGWPPVSGTLRETAPKYGKGEKPERPLAVLRREGKIPDIHSKGNMAELITTVFSPTTVSLSAKIGAGRLSQAFAEHAMALSRIDTALKPLRLAASKESPGREWTQRYEAGEKPQSENEALFQAVAHGVASYERQALHAVGKMKGSPGVEHYIRHLYKDPKKFDTFMAEWLGHRSLTGGSGFLQHRKYPTYVEAVEAGLEPLHDNDVDNLIAQHDQITKYVAGLSAVKGMKREGLAVPVKFDEHGKLKPPPRWSALPPELGTIYGSPEIPIVEGVDQRLYEGLSNLARDLGIKVDRPFVKPKLDSEGNLAVQFGQSVSGGGIEAGFATTMGTLAHEIGHQLDDKFGLWAAIHEPPLSTPPKGQKGAYLRANALANKELRALADLRFEGAEAKEGFKKYIRTREEKIANMVDIYVNNRSKMEQVAPMIHSRLERIISQHSVLEPLRQLEPSQVRGANLKMASIAPGKNVLGHWYVPDDVARLFRNHLHPGFTGPAGRAYRGLRAINDNMNRFQLGFSAFHGGTTAFSTFLAKTVTMAERLGDGEFLEAAKALGGIIPAPITYATRGRRLVKQALEGKESGQETPALTSWFEKHGAEVLPEARGETRTDLERLLGPHVLGGSMDPQTMAMAYGGFRPGAQVPYQVNHIRKLRMDMAAGRWQGAWRAPFAVMEALAIPIMDKYVPFVKAAIFTEGAENVMRRLGEDASPNEVRYHLGRLSRDIDNKFGEIAYDNRFWHRLLRQSGHASIRALGWTGGTIDQYGGSITDTLTAPKRLLAGKPEPVEIPREEGKAEPKPPIAMKKVGDHWEPENLADPVVTRRMLYTMATLAVAGVAGGLWNWTHTGEPPQSILDLYAPRNGKKNPDGSDQRVILYAYIKDLMGWLRSPGETAVNKLAPIFAPIGQIVRNRDYYGEQIWEPHSDLDRKLYDTAFFLYKTIRPLSVQNIERLRDTGTEGVELGLPLFGLATPAPNYYSQTKMELEMSEFERKNRGDESMSHEEAEGRRALRHAERDFRRGKPEEGRATLAEAVGVGVVGERQLEDLARSLKRSPTENRFRRKPIDVRLQLWEDATEHERDQLRPVLAEMYQDPTTLEAVNKMPSLRRARVLDRLRAIMAEDPKLREALEAR